MTLYNRHITGFLGVLITLVILFSSAINAFAQSGTPVPVDHTNITATQASPDTNLPQNLITQVSYDQHPGAQLPLNLTFRDETGKSVRLSDYFGKKPVIMILAYYDCPMLCSLALSDLTNNLKHLQWTPGKEFEVLTISFNPKNNPELASQKKAEYMKIYDRPDAAKGWSFLTGDQTNIDQLTKIVGFHYVYDAKNKEYAHPTGVIVFTPEGRISRYIFGITYSARDLRLALVDAASKKIGSVVDQFFLLCYHYNPVNGQYDLLIGNILTIAGLGTVVLLAGMIFLLSRQGSKSS